MIVGIDLGTTNSLIAYFTEEGPKIIPNRLGKNLTPSVVSVDGEGRQCLCGRDRPGTHEPVPGYGGPDF